MNQVKRCVQSSHWLCPNLLIKVYSVTIATKHCCHWNIILHLMKGRQNKTVMNLCFNWFCQPKQLLMYSCIPLNHRRSQFGQIQIKSFYLNSCYWTSRQGNSGSKLSAQYIGHNSSFVAE